MNILIISNGNGEDLIACNLIKHFPKEATVTVIPLVGEGLEYKKIGLTPAFRNKTMPSGGFIRNIFDLFKDIKAGLLTQHWSQRKTIKTQLSRSDFTLCIGDVFCLMMGGLRNAKPIYFFPTAKSDLFMRHSYLEKLLLKTIPSLVFPRDLLTTESLRKVAIPALYFGNPMMDNLAPKGVKFPLENNAGILGILPGSREEAYANIRYILEILLLIKKQSPSTEFLLSISPTLTIDRIVKDTITTHWTLVKKNPFYILEHTTGSKVVISSEFTDIIHQSTCILGLAGTANEQAIEIGKTVFCFEGFGPQSTRLRFEEQAKLLGENLHVISNRDSQNIADTIIQGLNAIKPTKKAPKRNVASEKIINTILTDYSGQSNS